METRQAHTKSHSSRQPSGCCDACSAREQIRRRISELESQLTKLKEEEREISSWVNTRHDPLQKMPIEVVSEIFEQTLDNESDRSDATRLPFGPQDIGQVCRYWREVAWTTSSLWNKPTISLNGFGDFDRGDEFGMDDFNLHFKRFQDGISRSGSLPLFVSILYNESWTNVPFSSHSIGLLNEYIQEPDISNRIVYLHLDVPFDWLMCFHEIRITSLKVMKSYTRSEWDGSDFNAFQAAELAANFANLETLFIRSGDLIKRLSDISYPKLTNLESFLFPIQVAQLVQVMHDTPTLRKCCCVVKGEIPPMETMQSPTVLQHLQHLDIEHVGIHNVSSFFDSLTLPVLQYLRTGDVDASRIVSLFSRSQCHLKSLEVTGCPKWTTEELESLLTSLPGHPCLSFTHSFESVPISMILRPVLASSTTSRIKRDVFSTFDCTTSWNISDNWDFIPEIFGHTSHIREQRPMGIKLYVYLSDEMGDTSTPWIPVGALKIIRELEKKGWRWSVGMYRPLGDVWTADFMDASAKHHQDLATA